MSEQIPNSPAETPTPAPAGTNVSSAPQQGTSGMAIAGLVCAFLLPLLGLIFSIIGLNQTKDGKRGGRGLAVAGLIISILAIIVSTGIWAALIFGSYNAAKEASDELNALNDTSLSSLTDDSATITGSIGQAVEAQNMELTVSSVAPFTPSSEYYVATEGKQFVAVTLQLKNNGTESETFSSYDFVIRDGSGREESDAFVGDYANELSSGSLEPGQSITGVIVYEVPVGDTNLTLVYQPSFFGDKAEVSL